MAALAVATCKKFRQSSSKLNRCRHRIRASKRLCDSRLPTSKTVSTGYCTSGDAVAIANAANSDLVTSFAFLPKAITAVPDAECPLQWRATMPVRIVGNREFLVRHLGRTVPSLQRRAVVCRVPAAVDDPHLRAKVEVPPLIGITGEAGFGHDPIVETPIA